MIAADNVGCLSAAMLFVVHRHDFLYDTSRRAELVARLMLLSVNFFSLAMRTSALFECCQTLVVDSVGHFFVADFFLKKVLRDNVEKLAH